jgi:hypothetical protein
METIIILLVVFLIYYLMRCNVNKISNDKMIYKINMCNICDNADDDKLEYCKIAKLKDYYEKDSLDLDDSEKIEMRNVFNNKMTQDQFLLEKENYNEQSELAFNDVKADVTYQHDNRGENAYVNQILSNGTKSKQSIINRSLLNKNTFMSYFIDEFAEMENLPWWEIDHTEL